MNQQQPQLQQQPHGQQQQLEQQASLKSANKRKKKRVVAYKSRQPARCDLCSKVFSKVSNLKRHQVKCKGSKGGTFDLCDKVFKRSNSDEIERLIQQQQKLQQQLQQQYQQLQPQPQHPQEPVLNPLGGSVTSLDQPMQTLLPIPLDGDDYTKVQIYLQALQRYLNFAAQYRGKPSGKVTLTDTTPPL